MNWLDDVGQYFSRAGESQLPQPQMNMFISERHKLLYSPVAKCACTTLKHLMVDLSGAEHRDIILKFGVHPVTANFNTGVLLKDYAPEAANKVLSSDDYYKFSVIREPVSRTISAYSEKFLVNRTLPGNVLHTIDLIRSVRGRSAVDTYEGISFREFVDYLLASDPADLDPHWSSQHYQLASAVRYNDIFCVEQLDQLAARLTQRTGQAISLGKHNTSLRHDHVYDTSPGRYVDKLPSELDDVGILAPGDFMDPELVSRLQDYFCEDMALYDAARKGLSDFVPQQSGMRLGHQPVSTSPVTDMPAIARSLTLYSKGFFAVNASGHGVLQILIVNSKSRPLALHSNGPCYLACRLRDLSGNLLAPIQYHTLAIDTLQGNSQAWETLSLFVPPELGNTPSSVTVSMQIGDSFLIEDLSPLHVTCAQPIRIQ
ncbi:MAG: sulfotransferase family protein [Halioglobus sp.]|nr:sulfotransferase family protein [Halioglobus sp.]